MSRPSFLLSQRKIAKVNAHLPDITRFCTIMSRQETRAMSIQFNPKIHARRSQSEVGSLNELLQRLKRNIKRDAIVQSTTHELREFLKVDRVVLYHFYCQWEGQVTFEALSEQRFSIFGSTGPDQCFSDEYAELYLAGRIRAIPDIETEPIEPCHRDFLHHLQVRANLVVPILTGQGLWGLLVAHHCQDTKQWSELEIQKMQAGAIAIANSDVLCA